jgi:hypothetical protein
MKVTLIDLRTVLIDEKKDQYAIDVVFKCNDCKHKYSFRKNNNKELEAFMESLKNNKPIENIKCPKCISKNKN